MGKEGRVWTEWGRRGGCELSGVMMEGREGGSEV